MLAVFKNCAAQSSMHGLSNLVNESSYYKILWLFFLLAALSTYFYHSSTLTEQYIYEPTAMSLTYNNIQFDWPDILVCLPANQMVKSRLSTWLESNISRRLKQLEHSISWELLDTVFWANLDVDELETDLDFGNEISAVFYDLSRMLLSKSLKVESIPTWYNYYCHRIRPDNEADSVILQLYDTSNINYTFVEPPNYPQLKGRDVGTIEFNTKSIDDYNVYFVQRNEEFTTNTKPLNLEGGNNYQIYLKMDKKNLLNTKRSPCKNPEVLEYINYVNKKLVKLNELCIDTYSQKLSNWMHGCLENGNPIKREDRTIPLCYSLTHLMNATRNNMTGVKSILNAEKFPPQLPRSTKPPPGFAGKDKCPTKCDYITYDFNKVVNKAHFPRSPAGRPSDQSFAVKYAKTVFNGSSKEIEDFLARRYIKVTLMPSEDRAGHSVTLEFKTYELKDLLSDLCGMLGFYMGISVLTILELLDLALKLKWGTAVPGVNMAASIDSTHEEEAEETEAMVNCETSIHLKQMEQNIQTLQQDFTEAIDSNLAQIQQGKPGGTVGST